MIQGECTCARHCGSFQDAGGLNRDPKTMKPLQKGTQLMGTLIACRVCMLAVEAFIMTLHRERERERERERGRERERERQRGREGEREREQQKSKAKNKRQPRVSRLTKSTPSPQVMGNWMP